MGYDNILGYIAPDAIWKGVKKSFGKLEQNKSVQVKNCYNPPQIVNVINSSGGLFVRVAGLSGAVAVIMGAYGAHVLYPKSEVPDELKVIFRTANYYHFLHSLALLAVPLTKHPMLVGSLLLSGLTVFSGTCYFHALTGNDSIRGYTPYGGMLLIFGWLAMVL